MMQENSNLLEHKYIVEQIDEISLPFHRIIYPSLQHIHSYILYPANQLTYECVFNGRVSS